MFNKFVNIIYNSSTLIPFILAIGIVDLIKKKTVTGIILIFISLILAGIQLNIKNIATSRLIPKNINITKLTRDENSNLSALYISYFAPFLQLMLKGTIDYSTIVLIVIGAILVIASHKGLENPVLKLLGYKTYIIESEHGVDYTLLSDREIRNIKSVQKVIRLTENRLLEVK